MKRNREIPTSKNELLSEMSHGIARWNGLECSKFVLLLVKLDSTGHVIMKIIDFFVSDCNCDVN